MLGFQAARSLCPLIIGLAAALSPASQGDCDPPEFMARADIPGLGMAEVRGQEIELSMFGYAESPHTCVTEDTVFEAASLTKPVVAYLVMRLVDQGRLALQDALIDRLPSLPLPRDDPRAEEVTVAMALSHASGLDGPDDQELRFVSDPGETFRYYPAGYRLVQRIIEDIEGDPLEAIVQREVFQPLGMTSSSFVFREDLLPRIATRHRMLGDTFERNRDPSRPANAAASMVTTPYDYALFLRAMMSGDGLSDRARTAMLSPRVTVPETEGRVAWGIGWGLEPERGTFFHYGDDGAAKSFVIGTASDEQAIAYFANSYYGMAIAGEIAERLVPGDSPAVAWLGYAPWDAPRRLARRDTLRAFVEGDADRGMEVFRRYERAHPDLDMASTAAFLQWVLEGRAKHEGRIRVIRWQIEHEPEKADHRLNLAQAYRATGEFASAIEALQDARARANEPTVPWIDAQIAWTRDNLLAAQVHDGNLRPNLSQFEGRYESWVVVREDDHLVFQTDSSRRYTLLWMHGTTFALEGIDWFRLRFVIDEDSVTGLIGRYSDGRTSESARTGETD